MDYSQFDNIRPYTDVELPEKLQKICQEKGFVRFISFFFPDISPELIIQTLLKVKTVKEFQIDFLYPIVKRTITKGIESLTYGGFQNIDKSKNYIFLSNHRDIILDSLLLNKIMLLEGLETNEVAIGSNLLILPWISDLVRSNKTFIVKRNVPQKEFYQYSILLSKYIRYAITEKKNSIWIAQKEGRTKNGDDRTQPGILKMFNISGNGTFEENFEELNIIPVSISYQNEPTDVEKVKEMYNKKIDQNYKKTRLDDLLSMGSGLEPPKGKIHFEFGIPINSHLESLSEIKNRQDKFVKLAEHIDMQIHSMYKLFPENYIAADKLLDKNGYSKHYTKEEAEKFENKINQKVDLIEGNKKEIKNMFWEIYGNPVINNYSVKNYSAKNNLD